MQIEEPICVCVGHVHSSFEGNWGSLEQSATTKEKRNLEELRESTTEQTLQTQTLHVLIDKSVVLNFQRKSSSLVSIQHRLELV